VPAARPIRPPPDRRPIRRSRTTSRWRRTLGAAAVVVLIAGACTGDDDDAGTGDDTAATADDTGAEPADTSAPDDTGDTGGDTTPATSAPDDTVDVTQGGSRLAQVQAAGVLRCGTRDELPGFAVLDESGEHVGFDSDFCRVIAAAVLGDAEAVEHVDLET